MARIGAPYRVLQTSHELVAESEPELGLGPEAAGPLQAPAAVPVEKKNRQKGARWEPQRQV